jgi:DUF1009 family protein
VSGQLSAPAAFSRKKIPWYSEDMRLDAPTAGLETLEKKIALTLPEIQGQQSNA